MLRKVPIKVSVYEVTIIFFFFFFFCTEVVKLTDCLFFGVFMANDKAQKLKL